MRYFQRYKFSEVKIRTDHSCLRWLTNFRGGGVRGNCDPMYIRWITELDASATWTTISYREGKNHQNADGMSRIIIGKRRHETMFGNSNRDCGFKDCLQCQRQFQNNRKLRPEEDLEDSDDEDGDSPPSGHDDPDSKGTGKDPNEDYNPDPDDYSLGRLMYVRGRGLSNSQYQIE